MGCMRSQVQVLSSRPEFFNLIQRFEIIDERKTPNEARAKRVVARPDHTVIIIYKIYVIFVYIQPSAEDLFLVQIFYTIFYNTIRSIGIF